LLPFTDDKFNAISQQLLGSFFISFVYTFFWLKTPWNLCKWAWNSRGIGSNNKKKNAENKRN